MENHCVNESACGHFFVLGGSKRDESLLGAAVVELTDVQLRTLAIARRIKRSAREARK